MIKKTNRNWHYNHRRLVVEPLERRCLLAVSSFVWEGIDGHLIYRPDAQADRVPDFSDVGYMAGRAVIPDVPTAVIVSPGNGDDTGRVQAAIDQVAAMPLDVGGFRGAVLLKKGHYDINTQITISQSGIVLRGEGRWENDTVLHARGDSRRALIQIDGSGSMQFVGSAKSITDFVVPVGARSFHVSNTSGLAVGDSIRIKRPSTAEWIKDTGMDQLDNPWQPGSKDLNYERVITRIEGNAITIDVPLVNAFEQIYGGGQVQEFTFSGRIQNVGIENLRGESDYDSSTDEDHAWDFISIARAEDLWVRQTKALNFAYAHVNVAKTAKRVTVDDAINHQPKSQITGGRRYAFAISGQQNLVTRSESRDGRHDYVFHSVVAGPNVFHDSVAINANSDAGPHHRWSTGGLFDNIVTNNEINARNRGNSGTGHGWAGANMVSWNSTAKKFRFYNPPTAQNWAIGNVGTREGSAYYDSHGTRVTPNSLYESQLAERTALKDLEYREYWLGDIDGFTGNNDSSVDQVYVDPAWSAAVPSNSIGFDNFQADRWVPFSFDFGLGNDERIVGATLALGMKKSGGSSSNDKIYLDDTSRSLLFSDLAWSVNSTENGYVLDLGDHLNLLQDGLLNLAVQDDTAIDWAVLNIEVGFDEQVTYVDDSFTANPGDTIADADRGTNGNQPAVFGVNAFKTIADAVAVTASDGTIIVNSGMYSESVSLAGMQTLDVTGPNVAATVTINSLAGTAGTTLHLEGSVVFAGSETSSVGRLNVSSNRVEPVTITIPAGHHLNVTGDLSVGVPSTSGATTNLTVTGGGGLNISNPSATVTIGLANTSSSSPENKATVDLSGLGSFTADVTNFRVGYGSRIRSTLLLSDNFNSITAAIFIAGDSRGNNPSPAIVRLGAGTNKIHADQIHAGLSKGSATIAFASQAAGSPGTVVIRGTAGGASAANITLGSNTNSKTSLSATGILDLRGHTADVVIGALKMAHRSVTAGGGASGTLSFDAGTLSVDMIDMSAKSGGDGPATATINISGGIFTVNAGGGFQLADHTSGGAANGMLNITGGTVTTNVDITDGGGTSTTAITLDGGTLDLTGHKLGGATHIDVLNFKSGVVRNVGQINDGDKGLTKTTGGAVIVTGANTYTGATTVEGGVLQVDGSITSNVAVNLNGTLQGNGTITGNVSGNGAFSPGNDVGRMTIHGSFLPVGTVNFEVNSPFATAGTDYDQYFVSGSVDLSDASLTINNDTLGVLPNLVTLIANDSSGSTVASSNPAEGSEFTTGSVTWKISYNGGDGNDVILANVNKPPSVALQNIVATLAEDASTTPRLKVADIIVTDDFLGTNSLSLAGADASWFEFDGDVLYLKVGAVLDHETNPVLDVTVKIDDATVGETPDDTADLAIAITGVNEPPVLAAIGDKSVDEGELLTFTPTAFDPDIPADSLSFSLAGSAPVGASINSDTGVFTWSPTEAQGPKTYHVTVRVADDGTPNLNDFETIAVEVIDPYPWQNFAEPHDVNSDGDVTPIDAFIVISDLNKNGARHLSVPNFEFSPPPYLDPSGDNSISPIDAFVIISFLSGSGSGEGEYFGAVDRPDTVIDFRRLHQWKTTSSRDLDMRFEYEAIQWRIDADVPYTDQPIGFAERDGRDLPSDRMMASVSTWRELEREDLLDEIAEDVSQLDNDEDFDKWIN